ncbi:MAG: hypothetical protein A2545_07585 [Planctomycetes bacterium RIFOXYD2_FULL_41_16]|nr:MAG: hypothetical protein A3J92_00370 [Planctomycetes bacterium RIFOXYC2_FULL_41_27]OHC08221.1 MAG: hypothetical protein A2545_07585 [Planctomycetes bacterium RIFOXYD2_FULL_41_16]
MGDCEVGKMRRWENEKNWKMGSCETEKLEMLEDKKLQRWEGGKLGSWKHPNLSSSPLLNFWLTIPPQSL